MQHSFSEEEVHAHVLAVGLEALITQDFPAEQVVRPLSADKDDEPAFELWKIMKARAMARLKHLHDLLRYGTFSGTKVRLDTGSGKWMELDLLGRHEEGIFVLELKVNKSAERNAFSELFAYSNYIAEAFAASGRRDITNVLVARLDNEITRHAFLYDLLITERDIIVYRPVWDDTLDSLRFEPFLPSDQDFRRFTNRLLSHDAISCVVASFHDRDGWYDSQEEGGSLNDWTKEHLANVSTYAAQLMEAEGLHGFCFMRKPWNSIPLYYRNALIICAINPFRMADFDRVATILDQIDPEKRDAFIETPEMGFYGRLSAIAKRAVTECLEYGASPELELPSWGDMVRSVVEVVINHKFAFRPTGMLREAFGSFLRAKYAARAAGLTTEDLEYLQGSEIYNWFRAWIFMEGCGFGIGDADFDDKDAELELPDD